MLSFIVGMIIISAAILCMLIYLYKGLSSLHNQYKLLHSSNLDTMHETMSRKERLSYTFNGLAKIIGSLFLILIGTLFIGGSKIVTIPLACILIALLYYNSKVLDELKSLD